MRADPKRGGNNSKDPRNGDPKEAHRSRARLREERPPLAVYPLVELLFPPACLTHVGECTRLMGGIPFGPPLDIIPALPALYAGLL
jgi:hypothetical protein